jgi:AraC-like DNA-binding protein
MDLSRWKYRMIFLDPDWVRACAAANCVSVESPVIRCCRDKASEAAVNRMMETLVGDATPLEKESGIVSMIEYLFEGGTAYQDDGGLPEGGRAKAVRDYIHGNFLEKITLDRLEDVSEVNKFRISRMFQDQYGIPPHAYQVLLRVNHAKKELRKNRPLSEIALDTGFYDQSHFIKAFRNHVGMTPEKYRETRN